MYYISISITEDSEPRKAIGRFCIIKKHNFQKRRTPEKQLFQARESAFSFLLIVNKSLEKTLKKDLPGK